MKMIQRQRTSGEPVLINADTIMYLRPDGGATSIAFIGGASLTVSDHYEAVAELFDPGRQAAEAC